MHARVRGWLAVAVAIALAGAFLVLAYRPARGPARGSPGRPCARRAAPAETSADPEAKAGEVRELLARRAEAVLRRSEAEFMATVDPQADPTFVTAQQALIQSLGGVTFSRWGYQVNTGGALPVPEPLRASGDYWAPRTTLQYALAGIDAEPTARQLAYLYVRRDGRWYLTSDTALEVAGEKTWRGPWDFGPCKAVEVAGGVVIGHPGDDAVLGEFAAELDSAVEAVTQVWGPGWSKRVAVLVPRTVDEMRELVGPGFNVDGIAAAAVADKVDVANGLAVGQRIVLNPEQSSKLSASARRIVLRHEITHVAARASTVDGAPMWLLEGFADYVGYRDSGLQPREAAPDLVRELRVGVPPTRLPEATDFVGGSENLDLSYQLAWSAALHVVDLVGEAGLVKLYVTIASDRSQDAATVPEAVLAVLGVDYDTFVAGWLAGLPARFG